MTSFQPLPEEVRHFLDSLPDADLQKLTAWFAAGQSEMQQWNAGNAKGYQVRVEGERLILAIIIRSLLMC